jgi:hypothetical protein
LTIKSIGITREIIARGKISKRMRREFEKTMRK